MRLDYWILVVDDQPKDLESVRESVEAFLSDEGFQLRWDVRGGATALRDELEHDRRLGVAPDLVLVDNKLGNRFEGQNGPHWAFQVRQTFKFTDILFYSSAGPVKELRLEIFGAGVDGVYSSNRDDLDTAAKDLIAVHVQRWLEPPATRALAVGQVVEFDESFRKLALVFADVAELTVRREIAGKYSSRAEENARRKATKLGGYAEVGDIHSLLHDADLGSHWIPDVARELMSRGDPTVARTLLAFLDAYRANVLMVRNILAHGHYDPARRVFVGAKGQEFSASAEACQRLRRGLKSYRDAIEKLSATRPGGPISVPGEMPSLV
jgi:DNA-binding NarL/FixJ family response regulator